MCGTTQTRTETQPKKILLIRLSSIGDIVLTTPVLRCIKQQFPETQLHFLTKAVFKELIEPNPYIDQLHLLGKSLSETMSILKLESFDYVIDLHNNLRTLRIKKALGSVPASAFQKLNIEKFLLTTFKIDLLPKIHIVDRYMAAAEKAIGIKDDGRGLDHFFPKDLKVSVDDLPMQHRFGYIAIVIGASYATKKLPVSKVKELCALITSTIVLVGGPEDRTEGEEIAQMDTGKIYNAAGKFTLQESAWLIQQAKVVLTNDTGMMHIAAAFQKPMIAFWGSTVTGFGMYGYYGKQQEPPKRMDMGIDELSCRPCSKLGKKSCPKGHFKCMLDLDMKEAAEQAMNWRR